MTERRRKNETQKEREARVGAKLLLRGYERELGGFTVEDLFDRLGFCRWLADEIRTCSPDVSAQERAQLHSNLQERLYVIELALKRLLGISESASPYDIPSRLGRRPVRDSISRSLDSLSDT